MIAGAKNRIGCDGALDREIPVSEVRRPARGRVVVERRLVQQICAQGGRVGNGRTECRYLSGKRKKTVSHLVRDPVRKEISWCAERSAKALDTVIGVAVFARWLVVDGGACPNHGLRVNLICNPQARAEGVHSGLSKSLRSAVDTRIDHRSRQPSRGGIRTIGTEVGIVTVPFFLGNRNLIAQADIQSELLAHFEIILNIPGIVWPKESSVVRIAEATAAGHSEQELSPVRTAGANCRISGPGAAKTDCSLGSVVVHPAINAPQIAPSEL